MNRAVFIDRDGVLLQLKDDDKTHGFAYKDEHLCLIPKTIDALRTIKAGGYMRIVATNQPVIARGIVSLKKVEKFHKLVNAHLDNLIDKFYVCPHHPEMHNDVPPHAVKYRIKCKCRKPAPGLLLKAAKELNINLKKSWMIGDMISDIAAGQSVGCKTIMIKSACNSRIIISATSTINNVKPHFFTNNIHEAANLILKKEA
jgi:mannose-1-phosphate guanylyltransferase / phosphomannomutase